MEIGQQPCMEKLEDFAKKLSPEHRVEVYKIAQTFYNIGCGDGAIVGARSMPSVINSRISVSKDDTVEETRKYLQSKIEEARKASESVQTGR